MPKLLRIRAVVALVVALGTDRYLDGYEPDIVRDAMTRLSSGEEVGVLARILAQRHGVRIKLARLADETRKGFAHDARKAFRDNKPTGERQALALSLEPVVSEIMSHPLPAVNVVLSRIMSGRSSKSKEPSLDDK